MSDQPVEPLVVESLVVDLARELYDAFAMGGLEPRQVYGDIRAILARYACPKLENAKSEFERLFVHKGEAVAYPACRERKDATTTDGLRSSILQMMAKRKWSTHWIHRSAYLHLESAELAEAVRGKRGDTLDESADVLITLLALSPHELDQIIEAAKRKVALLMIKPPYAGEQGTTTDGD
jgi:NTP pyrophosphatase (non-canonical NTP hydrolase)